MTSSDDANRNRWIAYELHDGLLSWLHAARMQLSRVQVDVSSLKPFELANQYLKLATEEGRGLIGFIESMQEPQQSLSDSVQEFVEMSSQFAISQGQRLMVDLPLAVPFNITAQQAWSILRIIQQAVQNAIQHAGPCTIQVSSERNPNRWSVCVKDSGKGFHVEAGPPQGHYGLVGMRQRAKLLSADLQIQSTIGDGTTITVIMPA